MSALRNKKFTKWKDVHNDVDSLIGESVNEGIKYNKDGFVWKMRKSCKRYYIRW